MKTHHCALPKETYFSTRPYSTNFSIFQHTGKVSLTDYGGLVAIRGLCYHNKDRSRNFSGMKTFHKPDWYSTVRLSREREDILGKYFKTHSTHSKNELATLIGPMYAEIFLPALVSIICNILSLTISTYWFKGVTKLYFKGFIFIISNWVDPFRLWLW